MFIIFSTFFATLIVANAKNIVQPSPLTCAPDCSIFMKCGPYASSTSTVWALADNECVPYKTSCIARAADCRRVHQCLSSIVITTQQDCQAKCPICDNLPSNPVCGWFPDADANGDPIEESITFANECELRKFSCVTGRGNLYPTEGAC